MAEMRIGVVGASGRMGRAVIQQVTNTPGCAVVVACEHSSSEDIGRDAGDLAGCGSLGVKIEEETSSLFGQVDAMIEFSVPEATVSHSANASKAGCIHIIGTTGLTTDDEIKLREAAEKTTVVYAPNMSMGVNILFALTKQVSAILDDDFDIEIVEMHHRHKVDAPSGTALGLGRAAAAGRGTTLEKSGVLSREGIIGPRKNGEIGFATLRGGDVAGDHKVVFAADGERLELSHKAGSRQIFARGAVQAALWARDKDLGLYTMLDVLSLG
jgi:4-hydroxy-tetrahydrodipicolinate reductase